MTMEITLKNGNTVLSVASFNRGNSHFIVDDGCYVLINNQGGSYGVSPWLFQEAIDVLKTLPSDPREAEPSEV